MNIQLKRVYEAVSANDGYRVFVDRLWPRGVKKQDLHYDLWAKQLAPSTPLRHWYHQNEQGNWDKFKQKYLLELNNLHDITTLINQLSNQPIITLLYSAKDKQQNHAIILKSFIENNISKNSSIVALYSI